MAWMHKTVVKEYEMDNKNQENENRIDEENLSRTDTCSPDGRTAVSSPFSDSEMSNL